MDSVKSMSVFRFFFFFDLCWNLLKKSVGYFSCKIKIKSKLL